MTMEELVSQKLKQVHFTFCDCSLVQPNTHNTIEYVKLNHIWLPDNVLNKDHVTLAYIFSLTLL